MNFQSVHDPPGEIWLNQIPGTDEYEFSGKHAEIWFALQVNSMKLKHGTILQNTNTYFRISERFPSIQIQRPQCA